MLIFHPASNEVKYSYYHSLPPSALSRKPIRILLYMHNCPDTQSYSELEAGVKNNSIPLIHQFCETYKYTLLVPVNPTINPTLATYSDKPHLDFYDRPDATILKMVKNFLWMLKVNGYTVHQKVFLMGFSDQGSFANLFSIFYPDLVQSVAVGDSDVYMYPAENINDVILNYPYGTYDILKFQPNNYSLELFKKIPHFIFDSSTYNGKIDSQSNEVASFIKNTFGQTQKDRAKNFADFLINVGVETKFQIYGPETNKAEITKNCMEFFESCKI